MRVVHISTYDIDGGAARGHSVFTNLCWRRVSNPRWCRKSSTRAKTQSTRCRAREVREVILGELVQKQYFDTNRTNISTTWFSLGWPGEDVSTHPVVREADIIHLHWVSGFVSPTSIKALQSLGKPLVWSLHDQRAFTGGCHYSGGCRQFENGSRLVHSLFQTPVRSPRPTLPINHCFCETQHHCGRPKPVDGGSRAEQRRVRLLPH